jgi:uncharacterized protein GlcG (DUF336 family)
MRAPLRLALLGGLFLLALDCRRNATTAAESEFHDKPASPRSLPGDNLPPFGMLDDSGHLVPAPSMPPGALHRGPGSPPESTASGVALNLAIIAARTTVERCAAAGYRIGAAVIDSAGEARAMLTADGSDGSHVFVAMRKALTALAFKMPSSTVRQTIGTDKALLARVTPYMFVEGGAVPILEHGEVVGAIGASGAGGTPIGKQDEICASAGLAAISGALK